MGSTLDKAFEFLRKHKDTAFTTVDGDKPKARVFQVMKVDGHTLYFCTATYKEVYKQLQKNPNVEVLGMRGNISVRVTGRAVFDVDDQTAQEIYNTNPVLPRLYKNYKDLVYFRLAATALDYYDLTPTPPLLDHYELDGEK